VPAQEHNRRSRHNRHKVLAQLHNRRKVLAQLHSMVLVLLRNMLAQEHSNPNYALLSSGQTNRRHSRDLYDVR
jgi:hypothetical protein